MACVWPILMGSNLDGGGGRESDPFRGGASGRPGSGCTMVALGKVEKFISGIPDMDPSNKPGECTGPPKNGAKDEPMGGEAGSGLVVVLVVAVVVGDEAVPKSV